LKTYPELQWTDELTKKFWDYESQFVQNYFTFQVGRSVVEELAEYYPKAENVLDYGCGLGFLLHHLIKKGFDVTGLEFSEDSIKSVTELFSDCANFKGVYGLELLEQNKKFDLIYTVEVIEHLSDEHLEMTGKNVLKLLAPGGRAIFTTPHAEDRSKNMILCPSCEHTFHRWQHVRTWSIDILTLWLETSGFKIIDVFATNFSNRPIRKVTSENRMESWFAFDYAPHLVAIVTAP